MVHPKMPGREFLIYGVEIDHELLLVPWSWYLYGRDSNYLLDDLVRVFRLGWRLINDFLDSLMYCGVLRYG